MFKKILCSIFILCGVYITSIYSNTHATCKNVENNQLKLLENTDWIPVQWDTGDCYFHNKLTGEDTDNFPNLKEYSL